MNLFESLLNKNRDESYDSFCKIHWEIEDNFIFPDGTKKLARPIDHNIVVKDAGKLIACLMKGQTGYRGITYYACGSGLDTWGDYTPPAASETDTRLTNEIFRKAITASDITFIDENNATSSVPTNRIQVKVVFNETDFGGATVTLREIGLFGGDASSSSNTGIMLNHKNHQKIIKTNELKLERTVRITF